MLLDERFVLVHIATPARQNNLHVRFQIASRLDQDILSFLRFHAARIKNVIALCAGRQQFRTWRRMIQWLALDIIEAQQPRRDILRVRVNLQRTWDELLVSVLDEHTRLHAVAVIPKIVIRRAGEVVRRSVLMDYP